MEQFWASRKAPMQRNGYVGFHCLGLVWIWFGMFCFVLFFCFLSMCKLACHDSFLILSSRAHKNIPRLGWGTPAVPMFPSELPKPWVFSPNSRLDLPWLLFFWLWSKMSSCRHLTVFSSNPFFKHRQQLVGLSPSARTTTHPHHIHMQTSPQLSPNPCLVLPWSIRKHSFSLAGEHVWNGFVFTHLVSDAGLFNYPPSAYHLEQQAVQIKPNGCTHPRRGGWKGILAFFF